MSDLIGRAIGRMRWWQFLLTPILGLGAAAAFYIYSLSSFGYWDWSCWCDVR